MNCEEIMLRLDRALPLLVQRVFHRTKTLGVGPAAMMVLRKLRHEGTCTVSELADSMGVTSATITGITNKLATQSFIERTRDSVDRRVVHIRLTEAGDSVLKAIELVRQESLARILSRLPVADQKTLLDLVERLVEATQE